jgi:hypothetical protein
MASPGRGIEPERIICWQFENVFLMGETRWVHMDSWSGRVAELGYQEHLDLIRRGYQQHQFSPTEATFHGPHGPIPFQFTYEDIYFMTNQKTSERCRIRRIEYVVTAPPNQMTNRS